MQPLKQQGGHGLLVWDPIIRAVRTESASAVMHHFGVGSHAVWNWRKEFLGGAGKFRSPGSKAAHYVASKAGAQALKAKEWTEAECDAKAATAKRIGLRPATRWTVANGGWTAGELKLLRGRLTDAEVAARTGRTADAVRMKRRRTSS